MRRGIIGIYCIEVRLKSPTSIRNVIIGLAPTAAGYVWKYE